MAKAKKAKKARTDVRGVVRITVALVDGDDKPIKGNMRGTLLVGEATASEVTRAVEEVLGRRTYALRLKR